MKKLGPILLLIIFLFNTGGDYYLFRYMQFRWQKEIKRMIRQDLHEEDLSLISVNSFTVSELEWIKENREFRYRGELYDVVRKEISGNNIIYHCIKDTKEKELIGNYTKRSQTDKRAHNIIKRLLQKQFYSNTYSFGHKHYRVCCLRVELPDHYDLVWAQNFSPPPETT